MTEQVLTNQARDALEEHVSDWSFVIAQVASAYASKDSSTVPDILQLVNGLSEALTSAKSSNQSDPPKRKSAVQIDTAFRVPAVPIEEAVQDDKVVCLCCGESFTMLKRHLKAEHGLTVDEYRRMFGLPEDMPLVAPSYSARKASFAREAGLGKHSRTS